MVAACDPNETLGRAAAETAGCRYVADYREILGDIDIASIVVPTGLHRRVALDCLAAGVDVLVEKPIAGTLADGQAIVDEARLLGRTLAVGHVERFNPTFEAAAPLVRRPKYIRAERTSPYAFRSTDISAVHDLMIHDIELVLALAAESANAPAEVTRVEAMGVCLCGGHPDVVQARLYLSTGCIADLVANRVSPTVTRELQTWSAEGSVTMDLQQRTVTRFAPGPRVAAGELPLDAFVAGVPVEELKPALFADDGFFGLTDVPVAEGDALTAELADFAAAVVEQRLPRVTGESGLAALRVADRVLASVESHRWSDAGLTGPNVLLPPRRRAA